MKILDATCGEKGIWFQKNHPFVTFMDIRKGKYYHVTKNGKKTVFEINPDVVSEWKDCPFPDNHFDMIIFDPPHIIRGKNWNEENCKFAKEYGRLYSENWEQTLKEGINKLFRVLKTEGVFILKWCEQSRNIKKVIKLFPYKPLFGTQTGQKTKTYWICFIKYGLNKKLEMK